MLNPCFASCCTAKHIFIGKAECCTSVRDLIKVTLLIGWRRKNQAPGRIRTHDLSVTRLVLYCCAATAAPNFWLQLVPAEIFGSGKNRKSVRPERKQKNWINRFHRKNNEWPKLASEASREVKSFSATKKFEAFLAPREKSLRRKS